MTPEERADIILDSGPLVFGTADGAHYHKAIVQAISEAIAQAVTEAVLKGKTSE